MVKADEKIIDEFLGTREVGYLYTPRKCMRLYWTKNDMIIILTPSLQGDDEILNKVLKAHRIAQKPIAVSGKYKRGKYLVYTFENESSGSYT